MSGPSSGISSPEPERIQISVASVAIPKAAKAASSNDILSNVDCRSATGRRIRDLVHAFISALGGPAAANDLILMASIRRAAELIVMAETIRKGVIRRGWANKGEVAELCRLEGAADRALRRLRFSNQPPQAK
jgi:hypothetical protein